MNLKRVFVKETLILLGSFLTALLLFLFLEKKFPDLTRLHLKIALLLFIALYAGRWLLRIFKGLMGILFIAAAAGILWILFKWSPW